MQQLAIGESHTPRDSTTLMTEQKTEHVTRRQPALFHGRACECWKADDVAGSIDVRNLSLKYSFTFSLPREPTVTPAASRLS